MAILEVKRKPLDAGRMERRGTKRVRSYTIVYRVMTDGPSTSAFDILISSLIPRRLPEDPAAQLLSLEPKVSENGKRPIWEATAEYSTDRDKVNLTPLYPETKAKRSWSWEFIEVPVQKDRNGKPLKNTAGDAYDPPYTELLLLPVMTIVVNVAKDLYSDSWHNKFANAVNANSYRGWARGKAMVKDMTAAEETYTDENDQEIEYIALSIKIVCNPLGWQPELLSQGFREKYQDDDGETQVRPIQCQGAVVSSPAPLDVDGKALFGDEVENAHFEKYETKGFVPFTELEFP